MLTSKLNLPLPGGWKDPNKDHNDPEEGEDYAAGVVGETGQILDQAGNPVARITEGEAKDLIGSVVAPSGEIISGSGDVIGRAAPLSEEEQKNAPTQPEQKKGGVDIMGVAKSMKGAYDTFNKIPGAGNLAGQVSKGLGFGSGATKGAAEAGESSKDVDVGKEGEGEIGADAEKLDEKAQATGEADTSKPDVSQADAPQLDESRADEGAAENGDGGAPINMEDQSGAEVDTEEAKDTLPGGEQAEEGKKAVEDQSRADVDTEEAKSTLPDVETEQGKDIPADVDTEEAKSTLPVGEQADEGEQAADEEAPLDYSVLQDCTVNKAGNVINSDGKVVGRVSEGWKVKDVVGRKPDENGDIWNDKGKVIGKTEPVPLEEDKEHAPFEDFPDAVVETDGTITFEGSVIGRVIEGDAKQLKGKKVDEDGDILDRAGNAIGKAERWEGDEPEPEPEIDYSVLKDCTVNKAGNVINSDGKVVGRVSEGWKVKDVVGRKPDENGDIWNDKGKVIGKTEPVPLEEDKEHAPFEDFPDAVVETDGTITFEGSVIGRVIEGDAKQLKGKKVDEDGDILDRAGNAIGKAERWEGDEPEPEPETDYSVLKDCKVNKAGNVINSDGNIVGHVSEGKLKDLIGHKVDENGEIWNDSGKVIGKAEPTPLEEAKEPAPFEDFPDAVVETDGTITFEGSVIGRVIEGDPKKLKGKKVDEDGDILDRAGNAIGKAERWEGEEPEPEPEYSILKDCKINKAGNVVSSDGNIIGRVSEGKLKDLIGRRVDENGEIWNDSGKVIGKAEPIPLEEAKEPAPFEDFPDAVVESNGTITSEGDIIGRVIEGDAKKLKGKKVDEDGDILDRAGNVIGKAERWEEEEPEPEPEVDMSILAGKRVNKMGNVVDSSGTIYGRLVEGDPKRLAGRMCDKDGNVRSESGDVIGRVELVSEGEREGVKDGPFAELPGCTVAKDGKVVTSSGDVVGRLIEGDSKVLYGRPVDEDGDVLDRNGNQIGRAERWEEPVEEKPQNPMCGRKVNREGNVVDVDGNIIGKLTSGELSICAGKEIDNDGDVVDGKGTTVGHASLLEDIPEPEPEETEEERQKRLQAEEDKKLAQRMAACVEQCLDKIRPICSMITEKIDKADRTPKEELDEEELVKEVKPLIEEGHKILQEANGIIRGLDPDGHIQANAKHKTASREASPEEYHLADVLKELTGTVTECIESAKRKIQDMPHAKKELNPLWALLTEPLGQIIAAVGLLLNGVLELVGRLLNGLGLGGLVNNLLGGLGLTNVLKGLGIGSVVDSLTGQKKKK